MIKWFWATSPRTFFPPRVNTSRIARLPLTHIVRYDSDMKNAAV
jgi:hypothetical protein